jgi:hypothetical protein
MIRFQRFEVSRALDPMRPLRSIGYDVAQCVANLFDHIAHQGLDPSDADLTTLRVDHVPEGVRASVYVKSPEYVFDRPNLTL